MQLECDETVISWSCSPTVTKRPMFWLPGTPAIAVDPNAVQRYERERMTAVSGAVSRRVNDIVSRCAIITHECC